VAWRGAVLFGEVGRSTDDRSSSGREINSSKCKPGTRWTSEEGREEGGERERSGESERQPCSGSSSRSVVVRESEYMRRGFRLAAVKRAGTPVVISREVSWHELMMMMMVADERSRDASTGVRHCVFSRRQFDLEFYRFLAFCVNNRKEYYYCIRSGLSCAKYSNRQTDGSCSPCVAHAHTAGMSSLTLTTVRV